MYLFREGDNKMSREPSNVISLTQYARLRLSRDTRLIFYYFLKVDSVISVNSITRLIFFFWKKTFNLDKNLDFSSLASILS